MGQKANPIGNRLGINRGWYSNWYSSYDLKEKILEDYKIREYLNIRLEKANISHIYIERTLKFITLTVQASRPGIIIGKGGQEVEKLKEELKKYTSKDIQINITDVRRPETDATLVANSIAKQIKGRVSYKRATKLAISSAIHLGIEGMKIKVSGRLNGAEMARSEVFKEGRTPLHTLRADIDYALAEAQTTYGIIGIKVWVCKGELYGKKSTVSMFSPTPLGGKDMKKRGGGNKKSFR